MGWFQQNAPGAALTGTGNAVDSGLRTAGAAAFGLGGTGSGPGMASALQGAVGRTPAPAGNLLGPTGPPPGYHYEGIDWDQHLVPDDPTNPNTPPSMKLPTPGMGTTMPPDWSKSPGMPAMGEGPGGWTGQNPHVPDWQKPLPVTPMPDVPTGNQPDWGEPSAELKISDRPRWTGQGPIAGDQLGRLPTGTGNLLGPNPIRGGNAMGGDSGMVQLRAPTGEVRAVPAANVSRLVGLGAQRI